MFDFPPNTKDDVRLGKILWAHQDLKNWSPLQTLWYATPFLAEFGPGGKYEHTVGKYRENESSEKIGDFNKELIEGLPSSVKWIAHCGAGYDPVDVHACKARGTFASIFSDPIYSF